MKNPILSVKKLRVGYGENIVIKEASFEIEKGDFISVVGANGSGKSSLMRAILGLIKPISGSVKYGKNINNKRIGYLPQETKIDLNFPATVREIVLSGNLGQMSKKIFYSRSEKQKMADALKLLGISKLMSKSFSELSGGQKQKVLLSRALAATDKMLILDEPSNNLDYRSRNEFYELLKKLNKEQNLTIVMITHDLDVEDLIGNKVMAITSGEVEIEKTEEYIRRFR